MRVTDLNDFFKKNTRRNQFKDVDNGSRIMIGINNSANSYKITITKLCYKTFVVNNNIRCSQKDYILCRNVLLNKTAESKLTSYGKNKVEF